MMDALEPVDKKLILGGVVVSVLAGVLGQLGLVSVQAETMIGYATAIVIVPGIYFIYRARNLWGGHVARYLELIGLGMAVHMLLWIPHIWWHLQGMATADGLPPAMLGLDPAFWYIFFHGFSLAAFGFMTYGFYLFWTEGE